MHLIILAVVAFGLREKLNYEGSRVGGTYVYILKVARISTGAPGFFLRIFAEKALRPARA